ncbi:MAG: DUF4350 domain-containing protein [Sphingobacteriales bacterium]
MKSLKFYLVIAGVILALYIVAEANRPKPIDWSETFSAKDKNPFGTYILSNRLTDLFPNAEINEYRRPVYNVIAEDSLKQASYIIICRDIDLSQVDYQQLLKYVKAGNDVFIAAESFGRLLETTLHVTARRMYLSGDAGMPVNFVSPSLHPGKSFSIDKATGTAYFTRFDTVRAAVLSETENHKANLIRYAFGKGSLYLASEPKFFSNYSLLKPQGAEYAATALSFVKNTPQVAWDTYYTQGDEQDASLMRVFLTRPALQWAYYIAIFSLLLFVLFGIKRRQRVIPVIEPLSNSTLDFVNVVGQVYYEKRNNANIAQKKALYLLAQLRDEFQIKTNKLDDEFTEKLTAKLGLETGFANELVNYLKFISVQDHVSDRELIELNKLIEQLYIQSR